MEYLIRFECGMGEFVLCQCLRKGDQFVIRQDIFEHTVDSIVKLTGVATCPDFKVICLDTGEEILPRPEVKTVFLWEWNILKEVE